jgi:4-hydroxy-tetrahydrodipicolinate synthase
MMNYTDLEGIFPAVVVPMRSDYSIDYEAYAKYIKWVLSQKPAGIAVNVDTGEGPYLTLEERRQVISVTREVVKEQCFIVAGIGGPATSLAITNAQAAKNAGADALLIFPTPAYLNDPLDESIPYLYHKAIAETVDLPIIVFQLGLVFGGANYTAESLRKLLSLPQIIGLKDASFDPQRFVATRNIVQRVNHPITLLTGNDTFLLESFLLGAKGGLLGFGSVGVGLLNEMLTAVKELRFIDAIDMQPRVQGFCDYIYAKPYGDYRARAKVALVSMGLLSAELTYVRPPYLSLWEKEKENARKAVVEAGLENNSADDI